MSETTDCTFDVFLTHSAKDKTVVRDVVERLKNDGLKVARRKGLSSIHEKWV